MDYVVELNFEGPGFVAVPNAVVDDTRLGADALAVLVYLARLAGGRGSRIVRVGAILKRFGFGKDKWQRIARELRAVGALADNFGRSEDGRNVVRSLSVGWPLPVDPVGRETRLTRVGACGPGNPAHTAENPAEVSRKTRLLKREQTAARGGASKAQPPRAAGVARVKAAGNAGGSASSRCETSPPASAGGGAATAQAGGRVDCRPAVAPAASGVASSADRAALAAALGLPVLDASGQWVRPVAASALAENGAGR